MSSPYARRRSAPSWKETSCGPCHAGTRCRSKTGVAQPQPSPVRPCLHGKPMSLPGAWQGLGPQQVRAVRSVLGRLWPSRNGYLP